MRLPLLIVVLWLSCFLAAGIIGFATRSCPVDPAYQARLEAPCTKCGSRDVRPRYCKERCLSSSPTLDPLKRGAPVTWGHEHIHRSCGSCSYAGDILECLDKEQP